MNLVFYYLKNRSFNVVTFDMSFFGLYNFVSSDFRCTWNVSFNLNKCYMKMRRFHRYEVPLREAELDADVSEMPCLLDLFVLSCSLLI